MKEALSDAKRSLSLSSGRISAAVNRKNGDRNRIEREAEAEGGCHSHSRPEYKSLL